MRKLILIVIDGLTPAMLERGDSEVPMLTVGIDRLPSSITEIAPVVLSHFGIASPSYSEAFPVAA
jgi:predicted AlkP superfamily phosphohydrolase/phosphomutase